MITIRPIHTEEIPAAKRVLLSVAYNIYGWKRDLEDMIRIFEATDEFKDMDHFEEYYNQNGGLFLAVLDGDKVIGSGAVRNFDEEIAELKRMWLLETYHGKGIGYQVIKPLSEFAGSKGNKRVVLQTSHEQSRAIAFYKRFGFHEIECYTNKTGEFSMEIRLETANFP